MSELKKVKAATQQKKIQSTNKQHTSPDKLKLNNKSSYQIPPYFIKDLTRQVRKGVSTIAILTANRINQMLKWVEGAELNGIGNKIWGQQKFIFFERPVFFSNNEAIQYAKRKMGLSASIPAQFTDHAVMYLKNEMGGYLQEIDSDRKRVLTLHRQYEKLGFRMINNPIYYGKYYPLTFKLASIDYKIGRIREVLKNNKNNPQAKEMLKSLAERSIDFENQRKKIVSKLNSFTAIRDLKTKMARLEQKILYKFKKQKIILRNWMAHRWMETFKAMSATVEMARSVKLTSGQKQKLFTTICQLAVRLLQQFPILHALSQMSFHPKAVDFRVSSLVIGLKFAARLVEIDPDIALESYQKTKLIESIMKVISDTNKMRLARNKLKARVIGAANSGSVLNTVKVDPMLPHDFQRSLSPYNSLYCPGNEKLLSPLAALVNVSDEKFIKKVVAYFQKTKVVPLLWDRIRTLNLHVRQKDAIPEMLRHDTGNSEPIPIQAYFVIILSKVGKHFIPELQKLKIQEFMKKFPTNDDWYFRLNIDMIYAKEIKKIVDVLLK
ncbi:MAG: hypothetical protein ABIE74_05255 [Pseudomonadota bacterium]